MASSLDDTLDHLDSTPGHRRARPLPDLTPRLRAASATALALASPATIRSASQVAWGLTEPVVPPPFQPTAQL